MGFRFRKRTRLFPGVNINWSKNGLSSISLGGPGATVNIPVARSGGTRSTVGLPGTGLSYSSEAKAGRSTSQRRQQLLCRPPRKAQNRQNGSKPNTGAFPLKAHVQKTVNRNLHSFSAK